MPLLVPTLQVELRYRALKMFTYLDGMRTVKQSATLIPGGCCQKKLLEINVTDYKECLEFLALFNDISSENLVGAGPSLPESCMLFSRDITHLSFQVLVYYTSLPRLNSSVISNSRLLQSQRIPFLGSITMTSCLQSAGTF